MGTMIRQELRQTKRDHRGNKKKCPRKKWTDTEYEGRPRRKTKKITRNTEEEPGEGRRSRVGRRSPPG